MSSSYHGSRSSWTSAGFRSGVLVQLHRWRPGSGVDTARPPAAYGGVAVKP
ncbi:MAG TPA: hypothetical protein VFV73_26820 [Streptosporangiaceae bacterium]|nr:hypothetical protein [Streptosporangiaceae bacterium]